MSNTIRLGVVGLGIIWHRAHKPALQKLAEHYTVSAFCSRTEKTREGAASEFPGAGTFADYNELVRSPEIDAVLVATPIRLNAPVAIAALKARKDVYLEKPMAASLEEADEIIALEKSSGRSVYVLEQVVYSDAWDKLIEVLNSGEIGRPVMYDKITHVRLDASADPDGYGGTQWRIDAKFPLGTLFDGGIHAIALLAHIFGQPKSVYAVGQSLRKTYGDYDNVNMFFEYSTGLQGFFSFSGFLSGKHNPFVIRGTEGLIALDDRKFTVEPESGEAWTHDPQEGPEKNPHLDMWKRITDSRIAGKPPIYTTRTARRDIVTLLAVEQSLKTGGKLPI